MLSRTPTLGTVLFQKATTGANGYPFTLLQSQTVAISDIIKELRITFKEQSTDTMQVNTSGHHAIILINYNTK